MANDRNRTDEQYTGPTSGRDSGASEEQSRNDVGEEVRGVADEGDEEFEDDMDDLEEDEESDGSF